MKNIYNYLHGILLSLSIILLVICFFFVNRKFIYNVVDDIHYEDIVYSNIVDELKEYDSNLEYELSKKMIKKDIHNYINHEFNIPNLKSKIKVEKSNKTIENIYIKNIKFMDGIHIKKLKILIYIISFIIVIITGNIFTKYKFKHKIDYVLLISGIINILVYAFTYIFNNLGGILEVLLNKSLHVLLFISCLEICLSIVFLNEEKIDNFIKRKDKNK